MATITYQVDASKAITTIEQFNAMVKASGQVIGDFVTKTIGVNDAGKTATGTIEQMDAAGRKLATTFAITGNAATLLGTTITAVGQQGAAAGTAFGISWQGLLRILEVQLFRRAVTGIVNAVRDGVTGAIDYQVQLQQVANVTNQVGPNFDVFAARIRSISEQFATPLEKTLEASQIALTSQLGNAAQGFDVLTNAMQLSQATGVEVAASTRLVTSTLQAFRLSSEDSGRVANTLFLAAQRSRVPLNDMQAAIGRVSQTAGGLGLSLEQITALFLTVSQQGGRPTEAFSLLNQVMGRLLEPTHQLQRFLNELGTPTGALAIQTFGLTGFLERLNRAAQESPERLGEIAGSVRTLRGLMAVTGDNTRIFQENLTRLNQNTGQVFDAANRVAETPAQRIRVEFEKIKNIFVADIGQQFISSVVRISDALGGASVVAGGFIEAIKTLILSFAAYKLGVEGIPALMNAWTQASAASAAGTLTLANSVAIFTGAATAAFIAGNLLIGVLNGINEAERARIQASVAAETRFGQRSLEDVRTLGRRRQTEDDALVARAFQQRSATAANAVRLSNEVMQTEINNHKRVAEEFRLASQEYLDGLRRRLTETKQAASQAASDIIQSRRSVETFTQQIESRGFQRQLQVEQDPSAANAIIDARRQRLQREAELIFLSPTSTREQIERARQIFQEIDNLNAETFTREQQLARLRAEQTNSFGLEVRNGQLVRTLRIDLTLAQARDNQLIAERVRLEEQLQQRLEVTRANEEKRVQTQQIGLRVFESLLRQQEQFKVFDANGQFIQEFRQAEQRQRGTGGTAALQQFDQLADNLRRAARDQGGDLTQINRLIEQRREAIVRELEAHRAVEGSMRNQNNLVEQQGRIRQQLTVLERQQTTQEASVNASAAQLARQTRDFGALSGRRFDVTAGPNRAAPASIQAAMAEFNAFRDSTDALVEAERRLGQAGGQTQANFDALTTALATARERAITLRAATTEAREGGFAGTARLFGFGPDMLNSIDDFTNRRLPQLQEGIEAIRSRLQRPDGGLIPLREQIRGLQQQLETQIRPGQQLGQDFNNAGEAAAVAGPLMQNALDDAEAAARRLNTQLRDAVTNFGDLANPGAAAVPFDLFSGTAGFAAAGGIAGMFPGRPKGTDILPYWLSPGEFIINPKSSREFYSQLVSIQAGFAPRYASEGGPVTIGDIHVNVIGGETSEKTIRDIGRGLDREIRRGTIRLGRK